MSVSKSVGITALFIAIQAFALNAHGMTVNANTGGTGVAPAQKETTVSFNDVYVQKNKGAVDPQELLVSGVFPNGCYKWEKAVVEHKDEFTHEVRGLASVTQSTCIMVLVPFTKEVDLGNLSRGQHTVRVMNGDGTIIEKQFGI